MAWIRHAHGTGPPPIGGHAALLLGNIMIVSSGNADIRGANQAAHREPPLSDSQQRNGDDRNVLQNRTWVLHLDPMRWAELPEISGPTPSPRYSHTVAFVESERLICLFGGFANNEAQNDIHFLQLDPDRWAWSTASWHGAAPQARYGHTTCAVGNILYSYGGAYKNAVLGDIVAMHCSRQSNSSSVLPVSAKGKPPPPRAYHSGVVIQNKFVLIFGGRGNGNLPLGDLFAFDTLTGEWHEVHARGTPPSARYNHSAAVTKTGKVIIFGGFDGKVFLNDTHILDIETLTWTQPAFSGPNPSVRSRHSAICVGNRVFVFGGTDDQRKMNDLHVLDMGYWEEVNKCYQKMQFLCGNNLELLSLNELEEIEEVYISGLRKVASLRKRKQDELLAQLRLQVQQIQHTHSQQALSSSSTPGSSSNSNSVLDFLSNSASNHSANTHSNSAFYLPPILPTTASPAISPALTTGNMGSTSLLLTANKEHRLRSSGSSQSGDEQLPLISSRGKREYVTEQN